MSRDFRNVDREKAWLFPPSEQDWLPEEHLARFVVAIVDRLDSGRPPLPYGYGGKRAYYPGMLRALLFFGYATGVFSSRKLEQATWDSVAFCIAANSHPDRDTIAAFRKRLVGELEDLLVQILMMTRSLGLLRLVMVSLDGTKIQANASRYKVLSRGYAKRLGEQLHAEIEQLIAKAEAAEAEVAAEIDVPAKLKHREHLLVTTRAAKAEIEDRAAVHHEEEKKIWKEQTYRRSSGKPPSPPQPGSGAKVQVNLTDLGSRNRKTSNGFEQACNTHAVVDNGSNPIGAAHVSDAVNDKQQDVPTMEHLEDAAPAEDRGRCWGIPAITPRPTSHIARTMTSCPSSPKVGRQTANCLQHVLPNRRTPRQWGTASHGDTGGQTRYYPAQGDREDNVRGNQKEDGFPALGYAGNEWFLVSVAWNLKRMLVLAVITRQKQRIRASYRTQSGFPRENRPLGICGCANGHGVTVVLELVNIVRQGEYETIAMPIPIDKSTTRNSQKMKE